MKNINQSISTAWIKKLWKYYKKYFFAVFFLIMLSGTFLATQIQKDQTTAELLISIKNTSRDVDDRPSILSTYKDLLLSEQAVNNSLENLTTNSEKTTAIVSSNLEFSQQGNSSLLYLTIKNFSSEEGEKILKTVIDYANNNIKASYPENDVKVIENINTSKKTQIIDLKFLLISFVVAVFLGSVMLILCDIFSSRILSKEDLEKLDIKIIVEMKEL